MDHLHNEAVGLLSGGHSNLVAESNDLTNITSNQEISELDIQIRRKIEPAHPNFDSVSSEANGITVNLNSSELDLLTIKTEKEISDIETENETHSIQTENMKVEFPVAALVSKSILNDQRTTLPIDPVDPEKLSPAIQSFQTVIICDPPNNSRSSLFNEKRAIHNSATSKKSGNKVQRNNKSTSYPAKLAPPRNSVGIHRPRILRQPTKANDGSLHTNGLWAVPVNLLLGRFTAPMNSVGTDAPEVVGSAGFQLVQSTSAVKSETVFEDALEDASETGDIPKKSSMYLVENAKPQARIQVKSIEKLGLVKRAGKTYIDISDSEALQDVAVDTVEPVSVEDITVEVGESVKSNEDYMISSLKSYTGKRPRKSRASAKSKTPAKPRKPKLSAAVSRPKCMMKTKAYPVKLSHFIPILEQPVIPFPGPNKSSHKPVLVSENITEYEAGEGISNLQEHLEETLDDFDASYFVETVSELARPIVEKKLKRKGKKIKEKKVVSDKEVPTISVDEKLKLQRRRESASWSDRPKTKNYSELFASDDDTESGQSDMPEVDEERDSDFCPDVSLVDSSSDDEISPLELKVRRSDIRQLKNVSGKRPALKETSVLTIELISKILELPVEELDGEKWDRMIKQEHDTAIFKKIVHLGTSGRRFKCYKCGIQVRGSPADMEEHMRSIHVSSLAFGCFLCPLVRLTENDLIIHERAHLHHNQKNVCSICDHISCIQEIKYDWNNLHVQCHPPLDEVALFPPEEQAKVFQRCSYPSCRTRASFAFKNYFIKHICVFHTIGDEMCDICGVTMNIFKLAAHMKSCVQKSKAAEKCNLCGSEAKDLSKHNCMGKYDCSICGAKFTSSSIKRHMRNVHGEKNLFCHVCGKSFSEQKILEDHVNTHTGAKPYQCLACGTWHTSQAGLAMHLRSRHNITTKQMREKYKNCPVPEPDSDPENDKTGSADAKIDKEELEYNKYTGRKRGRPSTRKPKDSNEGEEKGEDLIEEDGESSDQNSDVEKKSKVNKGRKKKVSERRMATGTKRKKAAKRNGRNVAVDVLAKSPESDESVSAKNDEEGLKNLEM